MWVVEMQIGDIASRLEADQSNRRRETSPIVTDGIEAMCGGHCITSMPLAAPTLTFRLVCERKAGKRAGRTRESLRGRFK